MSCLSRLLVMLKEGQDFRIRKLISSLLLTIYIFKFRRRSNESLFLLDLQLNLNLSIFVKIFVIPLNLTLKKYLVLTLIFIHEITGCKIERSIVIFVKLSQLSFYHIDTYELQFSPIGEVVNRL